MGNERDIKELSNIKLFFAPTSKNGYYRYSKATTDDDIDCHFLNGLESTQLPEEPSSEKNNLGCFAYLFFPIHWAHEKYGNVGAAIATLVFLGVFVLAPILIAGSSVAGLFGFVGLLCNAALKRVSESNCCHSPSSPSSPQASKEDKFTCISNSRNAPYTSTVFD